MLFARGRCRATRQACAVRIRVQPGRRESEQRKRALSTRGDRPRRPVHSPVRRQCLLMGRKSSARPFARHFWASTWLTRLRGRDSFASVMNSQKRHRMFGNNFGPASEPGTGCVLCRYEWPWQNSPPAPAAARSSAEAPSTWRKTRRCDPPSSSRRRRRSNPPDGRSFDRWRRCGPSASERWRARPAS